MATIAEIGGNANEIVLSPNPFPQPSTRPLFPFLAMDMPPVGSMRPQGILQCLEREKGAATYLFQGVSGNNRDFYHVIGLNNVIFITLWGSLVWKDVVQKKLRAYFWEQPNWVFFGFCLVIIG